MSAINASRPTRVQGTRPAARHASPDTAARIAAELAGGTADEVARRLRVLGHPTRLALIVQLAAGPSNVTDLASVTELDPAAASKHLCELQRASLVVRRQEGTHAVYALAGTTALKVMLLMARGVHADADRVAGALRSTS
jgi:DNA-binding transcriptional ArsR family regulator